MANVTTNLFQTLVAAQVRASESLRFRNEFVSSIYWDYKPVVATPNTNLNVLIPTVNEGDVVDIQSGPLQPTDTDHDSVQIPYNKHFSTSFIVKAWDQARTPAQLQKLYIQPRIEAMLRSVNRTILQVFTTTAFNAYGATYAPFIGASTDFFSRVDLKSPLIQMDQQGVPVDDEDNMFFITSPTGYYTALGDQTFSYQYIVGTDMAVQVQQQARLKMQFGCQVARDQHWDSVKVANGISATKVPAVLFHRYAVAGVTAKPATTDDASWQESTVMLKGVIPCQLQVGPSLKDQGTICHLHCQWGLAVARADHGILMQGA